MTRPVAERSSIAGWGSGLMGVLIFSGTLPATRLAIVELTPMFVTSARVVIAGLLGGVCLIASGQPRPARAALLPLAMVAIGVVIGFPLLAGLALEHITAARSLAWICLLPLSTALFGVLRGGERPRPAFWGFAALGAMTVIAALLTEPIRGLGIGDLLMIGAVLVCGLGYAEGAVLSRLIGGWQVISWALLLSWPLMSLLSFASRPQALADVGTPSWLALAYLSVGAMFLGFIFWYRGLSLGGITRIGQLQLLQPLFGYILAAMLLGERVTTTMIGSTAIVLGCVVLAKRYA